MGIPFLLPRIEKYCMHFAYFVHACCMHVAWVLHEKHGKTMHFMTKCEK